MNPGRHKADGRPALTERVKSLFRRRRPVTPDEADDLSRWVSEGGTPHPEGPPPVLGLEHPDKSRPLG
jgi:hypothetical protein